MFCITHTSRLICQFGEVLPIFSTIINVILTTLFFCSHWSIHIQYISVVVHIQSLYHIQLSSVFDLNSFNLTHLPVVPATMLIYKLIDLESTTQSVTIGFMPILSGFEICSTSNIYLFDVGVLAGYLVNSSVYGSWIIHLLLNIL